MPAWTNPCDVAARDAVDAPLRWWVWVWRTREGLVLEVDTFGPRDPSMLSLFNPCKYHNPHTHDPVSRNLAGVKSGICVRRY